jgi:transketolase
VAADEEAKRKSHLRVTPEYTVRATSENVIPILQDKATLLRIHSIRATTAAGSGHPTSCASAAEIISALFFSVMRYDPHDPSSPLNDAFILSKGHAAPILYAAWAEAGAFPVEELLKLRTIGSDLEGHPTPRLSFVPVATGSLGQGLSAGIGLALAAKRLDRSDRRIYVLLGDGESAEGAVWEGARSAAHYELDNLCATIDINRLGQSEATMDQHDIEAYRRRWEAFGWNAVSVDGHDLDALLNTYAQAEQTNHRPTVVLARTIKGKGIAEEEDKPGFHGKSIEKEAAEKIITGLHARLHGNENRWTAKLPVAGSVSRDSFRFSSAGDPPYSRQSKPEATRKAFGVALAALGKTNPAIVALDGDVKNSTYTEDFEKACPDRFFQMYIAEQNMVGAAMGLAAAGKIPFASTFACFLSRAYDFIRMAAISGSNIKLVGTHAGVSIGEDGPSQMGLEDLAMMCAEPNYTVLYPADAVSAWRAIELAAAHKGPVYIRTSRPKTAVIYDPGESFAIGRAKILRQTDSDHAVVVGAGVTLYEALKAHDELQKEGIGIGVVDLFSVQPVDRDTLLDCCRSSRGRVITVEDHYAHGGIGDAVGAALAGESVAVHKLAVREIPRSGKPDELLDRFGISARAIAAKVRSL